MGELIKLAPWIAYRNSDRRIESKRKPGEVIDITHFFEARELEKHLSRKFKSLEKMLNQYYLQFPTHNKKSVRTIMIKFYGDHEKWSIENLERNVLFHTKYFILNNHEYSF